MQIPSMSNQSSSSADGDEYFKTGGAVTITPQNNTALPLITLFVGLLLGYLLGGQ